MVTEMRRCRSLFGSRAAVARGQDAAEFVEENTECLSSSRCQSMSLAQFLFATAFALCNNLPLRIRRTSPPKALYKLEESVCLRFLICFDAPAQSLLVFFCDSPPLPGVRDPRSCMSFDFSPEEKDLHDIL